MNAWMAALRWGRTAMPAVLAAAGLLLVLAGPASAQTTPQNTAQAVTLSPGYYVTENGWGELTIRPAQGEAQPFRLDVSGANGHSCELTGQIRNGRAVLDGMVAGKPCTVSFVAADQRISVRASSFEACRMFCGNRAWFDGTYLRPPAACTPPARRATQQRFQALYKARNYAGALAELAPLLEQCSTTLAWTDAGRVRNDVAITQYHLGRLDDCRATLAPVLAQATRDEASLRDKLPPTDFDLFLPIARAAWFNARLCGV